MLYGYNMVCWMMDLNSLAERLSALGHPTRLKIIAELTKGENYSSALARCVGVSRALAKIHLKKLQNADLVESRVVVVEDEARARRFYKLKDFEIHLSNEILARSEKNE